MIYMVLKKVCSFIFTTIFSFDRSTASAHDKLQNGVNAINGDRHFKESKKQEIVIPSSKKSPRWLPSQIMRDVLDPSELIFRRVRGYVNLKIV